ncbi:uncharacterized protein [Palaemon carinicauda]|uniref:uncharacterized protein isoform X2 n=1 Tax=Palaemon carinicauda TaxID=392227 RepID=UPI0035B5F222
MTYLHLICTFSVVVALYSSSLIVVAIGDEGSIDGVDVLASWTQGESGPPSASASPDDAELDEVCKCLSTDGYSQPCANLVNYSPIIRDGACFGNLGTRKKRDVSLSDSRFISPPAFVANKKCQGTRSIVLSSSGTERQLTLTTEASVLICPGSIDANLQQLNVINVSKIIIAPGAFKPRDSNIVLNFANVREKIIIPEKAFSIKVFLDSPALKQIEIDRIHTPPPEVKLSITAVPDVEFKSRSIVAPIVRLKLSHHTNVAFSTKAIIPYVHPEASVFEISHCQSLELAPETINTGKFEAKYIKFLLMKERAVEVVEGKAKIEHVANMTLFTEALSVGSGADIILDNITLVSAGIRSIRGTGLGNIHRATFSHVKGRKLESVALCIRTETALVSSVEIDGKDGEIAGCLQGQEYHADTIPEAIVICKRTELLPDICGDPRCVECSPDTKGIEDESSALPSRITGKLASSTEPEDPMFILNGVTISSVVPEVTVNISSALEEVTIPTTRATAKNVSRLPTLKLYGELEDEYEELKDESDGSESSFLKSLEETPMYVIIIFFCAVIILIMFMTYMIYKCCTRNKHDKYNLPQENRLSTFRNPRTIMTPENLTDQSNGRKSNTSHTPEVFSTYDSYRRRPTATYVAHPETLDFRDSSGSIDGHSAHHGDVVNESKMSSACSSVNLNHPESGPNNSDHDFPAPEKDLQFAIMEEVPLSNSSPHPSQLPLPEGYLELDDQVQNINSPTSDNEYSPSENSPILQHLPSDAKLDHTHGERHFLVDSGDQALCQNETPLQNKFSSMELPTYAPPPVPAFDKVESDGDELVI